MYKRANATSPATHEPTKFAEERAAALISQMTLQEKVSEMVFDAPAIERLGIPPYNWWNECLYGVGRAGAATVFPQAIGLAASWNPDLMHRIATVISDEARAKHHEAARRGIQGMYTGLTFWSPNINIVRDPRWGRGQETYGEDPYLTAAMGVSFIKGLQGDDPRYLKLVATPKHYAVHSGPEPDRHHFDAQIDERDLRETYLPAFEACVKEARAVSVMGAYNRVNGEPCCASPALLEKILRQEMGLCRISCCLRTRAICCPCARTSRRSQSSDPTPTTFRFCWATTTARRAQPSLRWRAFGRRSRPPPG
jgi:beta-glucosidase